MRSPLWQRLARWTGCIGVKPVNLGVLKRMEEWTRASQVAHRVLHEENRNWVFDVKTDCWNFTEEAICMLIINRVEMPCCDKKNINNGKKLVRWNATKISYEDTAGVLMNRNSLIAEGVLILQRKQDSSWQRRFADQRWPGYGHAKQEVTWRDSQAHEWPGCNPEKMVRRISEWTKHQDPRT